MINIRNYFKSLLIVLGLLTIGWYLSLQLTVQRIHLEATNKLVNIEQKTTPYHWSFKSFKLDVVESFQQYWQVEKKGSIIYAAIGTNPHLSLNFSGETINTLNHQTLIINSSTPMTGSLRIQFKTELSDDLHYFSPNIKLSGTSQAIDLNVEWKGNNPNSKNITKDNWGSKLQKVSSLVLYFINPKGELSIDSISLPYSNSIIENKIISINCSGELADNNIGNNLIPIFNLSEKCNFPSNYLWLKHDLQQRFPGAILTLNNTKLWQQSSMHKINNLYTNNILINAILYGFLMLFIIAIVIITKTYKVEKNNEKDENWYKWAAKQLLFRGARKVVTPYHLAFNYSVVLIPTIILLLLMLLVKFPTFTTFKMLPMYFLWAIFQQVILGYVLAQRIFYNYTENRLLASLLAAAVFSILHFPSAALMIVTFVAGGFWAYAWLVFKRFIPLAISHASLALMFYYVVPEKYFYSAKVLQWFFK